ncbi:hypothetical protein [Sphaerisporangium corydalis]|uniref:DUF2637 domain-containing protein n=1 Tax=Sphaerisporangium corydalis TaxID=1441875 RepID=A0ABV9ELC2_9ACTN|nr:hypothetical protein [Sphaerisporangium corydalis]
MSNATNNVMNNVTNEAADLESRYRSWLRWYPRSYRRAHESEILEVLLAGAREGRRRPEPMECLDLVRGGLHARMRPTVPSRDRSAWAAIKLMYLSAAAELATAVVVLATTGDVRSAIVMGDPGYTAARWRAELTGSFAPLVTGAVLAACLCLCLAWVIGRGHRWARAAFALVAGVNLASLLHGLAGGSAVYAQADLFAGITLCLVQLAAVAHLLHPYLPKVAALWGAGPIGPA